VRANFVLQKCSEEELADYRRQFLLYDVDGSGDIGACGSVVVLFSERVSEKTCGERIMCRCGAYGCAWYHRYDGTQDDDGEAGSGVLAWWRIFFVCESFSK